MQSRQAPDSAILEACLAACLETWREQGADRLDPLAFHYMAALQRRLAAHDGDCRRVLEEKLAARISAYAEALERVAPRLADAGHARSRTALGELITDFGSRSPDRNSRIASTGSVAGAVLPDLAALEDFRRIWSQVQARSQARRSLQHSPTHAGPLNSSSLVYRSITLMREVSPGYLQHFMSYLDALSWLQQLNDHGILAAQGSPPATSGRVRARSSKPRKRREPV